MTTCSQWSAISGCIFLLVGCSQSQSPRCYPVRGQILFKNQPVAEGMVVFHPAVEVQGVPKPHAYTDSEGRFQLTSFRTNDGAPLGDYRITVELRQERRSGEELTRDGPNLLPPKYAKAGTSPLKFTVGTGENESPPMTLVP